MTRYNNYLGYGLEDRDDGDYVLFDEVNALLAEKDKQIAQLTAERDEARAERDQARRCGSCNTWCRGLVCCTDASETCEHWEAIK